LINSVFNPFISKLKATGVQYSDIFIGDTCWGKNADMQVSAQDKLLNMTVGCFASGNTCVTYLFCYPGDYDKTKNELINVLLKTFKINGMYIVLGK